MNDIETAGHTLKEVDTTQVFTTDLNGRMITLQVNPLDPERFFTRGVGYDGSSVPGHATVDESDKLLIPIPETLRRLDFQDESLGFLIGRIEDERGVRSAIDARALLETVLARAKAELGWTFRAGPEHEFFLLTADAFGKDIHSDDAGYFHADPRDRGETVRKQVVNILRKTGIQFEKMHHEVTPSQHEINLGCLDPLGAADRTVMFTYVTKRVAHEQGLHATFMPKPFNGHNRNALHIHLSAQDAEGRNVFCRNGEPGELSAAARGFVGGVLRYARETSIVMAATYNSYKAYVVGKEAPIQRGWGLRNRSSMVRVPYADRPENTRIEIRSPDPAGNIYLQMAAFIGMGLKGVKDREDPGEPDAGNIYDREDSGLLWDENYLPRSMFEALVEAEDSAFLRDLLGDTLYAQYMDLKKDEWEGYRTHVTPREHSRNLST